MILTLVYTLLFGTAELPSLNAHSLPPTESRPQDFIFLAFGDNRPAGAGVPQNSIFRSLIKEAGIIGPNFVISSGDLYYGNDDSMDQFRQEVSATKPLLESLPCPFFNAPGNHEFYKSEFVQEYNKLVGPSYGSFTYGKFRFLGVCTAFPDNKPGVYGPQLDWLKSTLSVAQPTIIFQHHPLFKRASNTDAADDSVVSDPAGLSKLYKDGGSKLVLQGHDHAYDYQVRDGIPYVITGGAGSPLDAAPSEGGFYHYMLVKVSGETVTATPVPVGALELTPISDGKAVLANGADMDIPVTNLHIQCTFMPTSIEAHYTKKKSTKDVKAIISKVEGTEGNFDITVQVLLPKHRATIFTLLK